MKVDCCICDECCETFETRASMTKTDKYAKGHRIRCPHCGSERIRRTAAGGTGRRSGAEDAPPPTAPQSNNATTRKGRQSS